MSVSTKLSAIELAGRPRVPVAYVPGLVMRRGSELYPGEAKDRRHAETGRREILGVDVGAAETEAF
jgi:hypothetical protein